MKMLVRKISRSALANFVLTLLLLPLLAQNTAGQTSTTSTSASGQQTSNANDQLGGYEVTSSIEIGVRGISLTGSDDKYRSDLNYRPGIRAFDSSFLLKAKEKRNGPFDELLVSTSGWGGDPNGYTRLNAAKTGLYRFDANVRRAKYFNNLANLALGQHTQNTRHQFSDFDLTLLPDNQRLRFNLGFSRDTRFGPGTTTVRFSGDEYEIKTNQETRANDFRAGVDAKVLGFNLSFMQGARYFRDHTTYFETVTNQGNNIVNTARIDTMIREFPTQGTHFFSRFSAHRLIARKLDITGRFIYVSGTSRFSFFEQVTGRAGAAPGNLITPQTVTAFGRARRPSGVGDIGITFLASDKLRISNTFRVDNFRINGDDALRDVVTQTTLAGVLLPSTTTNSFFQRTTNYRRFMNLIEADYQFSPRLGVHAGYRFTDRRIQLLKLNVTTTTFRSDESFDNRTHSAIFGFRARPVSAWTIYFDGEHGNADSVFTRLGNNDFTNFRLRNRLRTNGKFTFNASLVTKDNTNPSSVITDPAVVPAGTTAEDLDVRIKSRIFTSSVDWSPDSRVSLSGGYTHLRLTSVAGILLPVAGQRRLGESHYFLRDNFVFVSAFLRPTSKLTLYAGYRINKDRGHGTSIVPSQTILVDSYPMSFQTPEGRFSWRVTDRLEWNIGYQYFNFRDRLLPAQSYRAHLPYTSLRIYFGGKG